MLKTLFIINPASGTNREKNFRDLITHHYSPDAEILYTERAGHATELTEKAIEDKFEIIVAVGGDGTVNEIATALRFSDVGLYIIPCGSGNGLARHFKIPLKADKALQALRTAKKTLIDSGELNSKPFFCTAGVGFDAHIGKKFAEAGTRGFKTYIQTSFREFFQYKEETYKLEHDGMLNETTAFLISFANTSQYGNNATISPLADASDGFLTSCILRPFPAYVVPGLARRLFSGRIHKSKYMSSQNFKILRIEREKEGPAHIDGEPLMLGKTIEVKVMPASLNIFLPS